MRRGVLAVVLLLALAAWPAAADLACGVCGKTLVGTYYRMSDGRRLCPEDYEAQLPRCAACSQKIRGDYLVLQGATSVCRPCHDGYPACFVCGLPVRKGGRVMMDGRRLCGPHAARAVEDPARAAALFRQAQEAVLATFGRKLALRNPIDQVELVGQGRLVDMMLQNGRTARDILGLFRLTTRGDERSYTVFLVDGLPPERLVTVAAHEYAHAWQSENHARYVDCQDRLREGFAEWVSYKVNKRLGRKAEVQHLLAQSVPDYIEGLRSFLELERRSGVAGVLGVATTRVRL